MANQRLSSRYASAILKMAIENNSLDRVFADMQLIQESIAGSSELRMMLKSPIIKGEVKSKALASIFTSKVDKVTADFISLLVAKGRESFLEEMTISFIAEYNKMHKVADVSLVTAIPATEAILNEVSSLLMKSGKYSKLSINQEVDASIIGGFILKMDGQLLDNSILRKLQVVKKELQH